MADAPTQPVQPGSVYRRVTSPRVRTIDATMKIVVTIGGIGVIACVLGIMAYLALKAFPLFTPGSAVERASVAMPAVAKPISLAVDEYRGSASVLYDSGDLVTTTLDGKPVQATSRALPSQVKVTAFSPVTETGQFSIGYADGSVQIGRMAFETEFLSGSDVPAGAQSLAREQRMNLDATTGGYIERTPLDQFRATRPSLQLNAPATIAQGKGAIVRIDLRASSNSQFLALIREDGTALMNSVSVTRPLGGGQPISRLESEPIAYVAPKDRSPLPDYFFATGDGSGVLCLWSDGTLDRYAKATAAKDGDGFVKAETVKLLPAGRRVTAAGMLLGARTLIIGDDQGAVYAGFASRQNSIATPDARHFVIAHEFSGRGAAITSIAIGQRDRSFIVADAAGYVTARHMTSHKVLAEVQARESASSREAKPARLAVVAPKTDGFLTLHEGGSLRSFDFNPGYAESSLYALFGKVWYEGDPAPSYTWQSSAGEDTAEIKYSLIPLMFGTLKATIYAMLFAAPVAILGAIYTSEMLHPHVRNRIKPAIETMASLPSVVLGFIAALVIAPFARDILGAIMLAFFLVPISALAGAYLWQLLPIRITASVSSLRHMSMVSLVLFVSGALSLTLAGPLQSWLFTPTTDEQLVLAGSYKLEDRASWPAALRDKAELTSEDGRDARSSGLYMVKGVLVRPVGKVTDAGIREVIEREQLAEPALRRWLDGTIGTPWAGWWLLMVPASFIIVAYARMKLLDELLTRGSAARIGTSAALVQLAKFAITLFSSFLLASALASLLTSMGLDARDSLFGSYTQRNTLVVAIVMGFAIIPIIYTISEDALSAVPGALRSASLGCGATRWQTAVRVVLPIAGSGIFSACMIGLGRAAGETMIVLMATGNTPVIKWNIFEGMRTLAANIAVELPEATPDQTHYRILFFSGLCLFVLTFVVNTVAEIVRQRFRKRSAAL